MPLDSKAGLPGPPLAARGEAARLLESGLLDLTDEETVLFILRFGIRLVAGRRGVSERTLRRQFERIGLRLSDLLQERRRDLALGLLAGDLPVGAVALRLGFSSSQTFARFLRREFGATARELRRRLATRDGRDALSGAPRGRSGHLKPGLD